MWKVVATLFACAVALLVILAKLQVPGL